jgi:hypothetical protein
MAVLKSVDVWARISAHHLDHTGTGAAHLECLRGPSVFINHFLCLVETKENVIVANRQVHLIGLKTENGPGCEHCGVPQNRADRLKSLQD